MLRGKIIRHDPLTNIQIEKKELVRLLLEVTNKEREMLKKIGKQTWWDWLLEQIGY